MPSRIPPSFHKALPPACPPPAIFGKLDGLIPPPELYEVPKDVSVLAVPEGPDVGTPTVPLSPERVTAAAPKTSHKSTVKKLLSQKAKAKVALAFFERFPASKLPSFTTTLKTPLEGETLEQFHTLLPRGYSVTRRTLRATLALFDRCLPEYKEELQKVYRQFGLEKIRPKQPSLNKKQFKQLKVQFQASVKKHKKEPSRLDLCRMIFFMTYSEQDQGASAIWYDHRSSQESIFKRLRKDDNLKEKKAGSLPLRETMKIALAFFKKFPQSQLPPFKTILHAPLTDRELKRFHSFIPQRSSVSKGVLRATLAICERSLPRAKKDLDQVYDKLKIKQIKQVKQVDVYPSETQLQQLRAKFTEAPSRLDLCRAIFFMTYSEKDQGASAIWHDHRGGTAARIYKQLGF